MNRRIISLFVLLPLLTLFCFPTSSLAAALSVEEQAILEKSLSIIEIDREIARIEISQQETERSVSVLSQQLEEKDKQITVSREQAGKRIKAYYMGEQETLLDALLSVDSLRDFFDVLDYYQIITERDKDILGNYKAEYKVLKKTKDKLDSQSEELAKLKDNLLKQRERVALLQQSVDRSLSVSADPEKLKALIQELTTYWENVGLKEVRRYFEALSSAMSDFPDFLRDYKDSLTSVDGEYTLLVREEELNNFLHTKQELLNNMSFQFEDSKIIVQGSREGFDLKVEGHYTIENEPTNSINFHVDRLVFNGLELPDTTCRELENDFDLGFYPKKIVPFIEATEVTITKGTLNVKLKISLKT